MKFLQDRQCTYNVTVTRILVTTVEVEKQKYYIFRVCVCSLSYPARNAHEPYYTAICGLPRFTMFLHIISQSDRFSGKFFLTQNVCFDFLYKFVWNFSHSKNHSARYYPKCTQVLTFSRLMTYIYIYIYIYMSYRTANLQMLHFIYLFNKYTY